VATLLRGATLVACGLCLGACGLYLKKGKGKGKGKEKGKGKGKELLSILNN
jgi:hypothetical protein